MLFAFTLCFDLDASKSVVVASFDTYFLLYVGERKRIKKINNIRDTLGILVHYLDT